MKLLWKTYFAKVKRIYEIFFEHRDLEIIRKDYYSDQWISKNEMHKLMVYEITQLMQLLHREREDRQQLMSHFNLATMGAFYEAEDKLIKSGRIM